MIFDTEVEIKGSVIGAFLITHSESVDAYVFVSQAVSTEGGERVERYARLETPLLWDTATLSPFLTSISHLVINYWSLELSKKRATYPENKLNLSTPPN